MSMGVPIFDQAKQTLRCGCVWSPADEHGGGHWVRCKECHIELHEMWDALWKRIDQACQNVTGEEEIVIRVSKIEGTHRVAVIQDSRTGVTIIEQNMDTTPEDSCSNEMYLYGETAKSLSIGLQPLRYQ